jgi:hypothetical protein
MAASSNVVRRISVKVILRRADKAGKIHAYPDVMRLVQIAFIFMNDITAFSSIAPTIGVRKQTATGAA